MSDMRTREQERQTRTQRELERLAAEERGTPAPAPAKKKKVKEKRSTRGADNDAINAGAERVMQPIREQLREAVLKRDKAKANSLRQRLLALQATKI